MTSAISSEIKSIFGQALEQPSPAERAAFLDQVCGPNAAVRAEVEGLLAAIDQAGGFLRQPAAPGVTVDPPSRTERAGVIIAGRYKLLEQIGEGGMGTVWVAEQTEPVKRRVALKLVKPGMDTKQVLSRFEAERQALALMDHPNIARVLDGGMTDEGRPFFVMEYVKGLPLTQYCDDTKLTVGERLELFTQVCQAVQHAHQKGIIYRDLKPSNILVCLYDGQPVPKVIDFGLAKAMNQSLTEHTLYTAHGLMVGTPLYMSPEQAEFNNLDIDTRSDIYSLGVILYELLTGTTPLEKRQFKDAAWQEMVRLIKEEEPPRPSTRLSGSVSLPSLAAQRSLEPAKLAKVVRGELDWIVMKALEKDRSRRYETANGLARDVQRYLADESVEACPPSARYRLRKFVRRNMRALTTAALVGVMLMVVVGAVGGSLGWMARDRDARRAKLAGQLELILDEVKQQEVEQKWPEALAAARRAEALLAGGGGDEQMNRQVQEVLTDLKLVERLEGIRLEQAAHQDKGFEWADGAYAAAFREIGVGLDEMTADEAARRLGLRKAVAPVLGVILDEWTIWRYLSAKPEGGRALSAVAARLDDDPWRQRVRGVVAQIDAKVFVTPNRTRGNLDAKTVEAVERLAASPDLVRQPPSTLHHLGMMLTLGGAKPEAGASVLRKAHEQYPGDLWIINALALSLERMGPDYQVEALGFYRAALALRPNVGWTWYKIGAIQQFHLKNLDDANTCYRKAIELEPKNAWIYNNVGWGFQSQNKLDEASACYHKAIELDPNMAISHMELGGLLRVQKRLDESVASYRKSIEIFPKNPYAHANLGAVLRDQKKLDEAVACYLKAIEIAPKIANSHIGLGRVLRDQNKLDEAISSYQKAIELEPKNAEAHNSVGHALRAQKKPDEAIVFYRKAIELDPNYPSSHYNLGLTFFSQKRPDEAIAAYRKAIELDPNNASSYHRPHYNLGVALASQNKLDEAIAWFHRAIELDPKHTEAHANLVWHLATSADPKLRDHEAAVVHARKAVALAPDTANHRSNLGVALLRAGDARAAVEMLERADQLLTDGDHLHRFFLAMAYWQLGEQDKARQAFERGAQWLDKEQPDNEEQRRFRTEAAELLGIAQPVVAAPQ